MSICLHKYTYVIFVHIVYVSLLYTSVAVSHHQYKLKYIYIYIHYIVNNSWKEQRPVACLQSFSEPGTDARPPGPERVAPVAPLTQPGGIS